MSEFFLNPFHRQDYPLSIKGHVACKEPNLRVEFIVEGALDQILLSPANGSSGARKRIVGLWETTCFEFFIKNKRRQDYLEVNLSSQHDWNVFYFKVIKDPVREYSAIGKVRVESKKSTKRFVLSCELDIRTFPDGFWQEENMVMGVTSVTEDKQGHKEYWALTHLDPKPYFHNPGSFLINQF